MHAPFFYKPLAIAISAVCLSSITPLTAHAQPSSQQSTTTLINVNINAGSLTQALNKLARLADEALSYTPTLVEGKTTQGINGSYTLEEALKKLLLNTGLTAVKHGSEGGYIIKKLSDDSNVTGTLALTTITSKSRFGDAPAETGGFKAEYQTTATKMAIPLKETPQAISVVTRDSLDSRQAQDIFTALEITSSIASNFYGHPGPFAGNGPGGFSNAFSSRGQVLNNSRDIRSDGFAVGGETEHDPALYERIEVIKGPSGFYGQGSLGGFINMVRKKPQAEFDASVSAQLGSYNTYRGEVDITGALTKDENVAGRLIAVVTDADSFVDTVETDRTVLAPSVEFKIGENTRVLAQMLYQDEEYIPYVGIPLTLEGDRYEIPDVSRSFYFGNNEEKSDTETINASVQVDHELNDKWLFGLFLQGESIKSKVVLGNYAYGLYEGGNTYSYASKYETERDNWASELRLQGRFNWFGQEHKVLAGVEVNNREKSTRDGYKYVGYSNIYDGTLADLGSLNSDEISFSYGNVNLSKNQAIYAQAVFSLQEKTKLLIGTRFDRADQTVKDTIKNTEEGKINRAWTYKFGLSHSFSEEITAYTSYAQSFNPVTEISRSGEILAPETGEGYEVGLKTEWFNHNLGVNFALYRQDLDNRPVSDPDNTVGEYYFISDGLLRTEGIELEINGSPYQGLSLSVAASLLDSEYLDEKDDNYGKIPWGTIKKQFSVNANYEIQDGSFKGLGIGGTIITSGEVATLLRGSQQFVDGYERVDFNLSYNQLKNWDVSFQVRNIFDTTYIEKARGGGYANFFGAPRSILLKATYHFD
jgi:TonB-dependent siderophore receptor